MTTTPNNVLPQLTINDAEQISMIINEAEAGLEQAVARVRRVLEQRDLVSQWDDDAAAFTKSFEPIALNYYRAARALQQLREEPFAAEHRLSSLIEAQRV